MLLLTVHSSLLFICISSFVTEEGKTLSLFKYNYLVHIHNYVSRSLDWERHSIIINSPVMGLCYRLKYSSSTINTSPSDLSLSLHFNFNFDSDVTWTGRAIIITGLWLPSAPCERFVSVDFCFDEPPWLWFLTLSHYAIPIVRLGLLTK